MFPASPTLPAIIASHLHLNNIDSELATDTEVKQTTPTTEKFSALCYEDWLTDGFYKLHFLGFKLPFPALIKVQSWSLELEPELRINIHKARPVSRIFHDITLECCNIVNNPLVHKLLRCRLYSALKHTYNSDSPIQVLDARTSFPEDSPQIQKPIGFGLKSKAKTVEFTKVRKLKEAQAFEDDLFDAINPLKPPTDTNTPGAEIPFEFEVFPEWALKYLRLCYNI